MSTTKRTRHFLENTTKYVQQHKLQRNSIHKNVLQNVIIKNCYDVRNNITIWSYRETKFFSHFQLHIMVNIIRTTRLDLIVFHGYSWLLIRMNKRPLLHSTWSLFHYCKKKFLRNQPYLTWNNVWYYTNREQLKRRSNIIGKYYYRTKLKFILGHAMTHL